MKKEFVDYEIASSLKELEFNEPCLGYYTPTKDWMISVNPKYNSKPHFIGPNWCTENMKIHFMYVPNRGDRDCTFTNVFDKTKGGYDNIAAPLWQQVIDWFKDKHKIVIHNEYKDCNSRPIYVIKWWDKCFQETYMTDKKDTFLRAIEICKKQLEQ